SCSPSPEYRYHFCSNETTFTPNSTYQPTLTASSLPFPQTPCVKVVSTTPLLANPETTVYGLFFCHGDLTPDECQDCVSTTTKEIVEQYCPIEKVVVIWYGDCVLCYSKSHSSPPCSKLLAFLCITFRI
ncbi:cysteine-rich receptor-like protein kinase 25, partial [Quercus suber]